MIIMTIIAVWFVGSLALVLGLARAASQPLPEPDFEASPAMMGEQSGQPEAETTAVPDLKPAVA
jgi:hypothetical protein